MLQEVGRRRLHNTCLDYLSSDAHDAQAASRAMLQYRQANCMTDKLGALATLCSKRCAEREEALQLFHADAAGDALVLNKWFSIQASADMEGLLDHVIALKSHQDFILSNPNRARSLISAFAGNLVHFHAIDGRGYKFLGDAILDLDKLNPQVAARMSSAFSSWRRYDEKRQGLMREQLERVKGSEGLSKDTFEVVSRSLA
jgi:aminopeptidase N